MNIACRADLMIMNVKQTILSVVTSSKIDVCQLRDVLVRF